MRSREEARKQAEELVSRMTLEEKASQLKYNAPAITIADPVQPTMTNYQMMTSSLKEQMDTWLKQMPNETLEEYQLRISDEARAAQARKLEYEISTKMAADMLQPTEISFGDYNPVLKKLAVHATSMPDFYLDMDEKEAASLYGANNLQLKNQKYMLNKKYHFFQMCQIVR